MAEYVADISEFQQIVDFQAYKNAGFKSIIMRAGLGTARKDKYFDRNWSEAKRVGLNRVAYWFNYPSYNAPQDEAAMFNSVVQISNNGTEGLMADCENDPSARPWPSDGRSWMMSFLTAAGPADYNPFWYASPSFVRAHNLAPLYPTWPFFVANYGVSSPDQPVPANLWQFTSSASVAGISGRCDLSVVLRGVFSDLLHGKTTSTSFFDTQGGSMVAYRPGTPEVHEVVIGTGLHFYHRFGWDQGISTQDWQDFGMPDGGFAPQSAAISWKSDGNFFVCAALGNDGRIWTSVRHADGSALSDWQVGLGVASLAQGKQGPPGLAYDDTVVKADLAALHTTIEKIKADL